MCVNGIGERYSPVTLLGRVTGRQNCHRDFNGKPYSVMTYDKDGVLNGTPFAPASTLPCAPSSLSSVPPRHSPAKSPRPPWSGSPSPEKPGLSGSKAPRLTGP